MLANEKYIEDIEKEISQLQAGIKLSQSSNKYNKNIYGENLFRDMLNIIYDDVKFINANSKVRNMKGIDLICDKSNRCIQVTSNKTTTKVKSAHKSFAELEGFEEYSLEFFYLLDKPKFDKIKDLDVKNLQESFFNFEDLIVDINDLEVDKLEKLSKLFIEDKARAQVDTSKVINAPVYKDKTNVFGRENDLEKLDKLLKTNDRLALINGLGGIGKTTLAKSYFMYQADKYSHRYWMEYEDSLENSFLIFYPKLFGEDFKGTQKEVAISKVMESINNTKGENLLVVDNLNDSEDTDLIKALSPNWKVLITSRKVFDDIEPLELGILDKEAAKELFINIYKKEYDEDTLSQILDKCGGHALTIELIAKISKTNSKKRTLEDVLLSLNKHQFDLSDISYRRKEKDENLVDQLVDTFKDDILELDAEEKIILQNLSILATLEFEDEEFLSYMDIDEDQEDRYYDALETLSEYGLIRYEEDTINIHQVISDVSRRVLGVDFEVCESLIKSFNQKIVYDLHNSFLDYISYMIDNETILKHFGDKKEELVSNIYGNLSSLYKDKGELEEALKYQKKNIEIKESIYENKNHPNLATAFGNLSGIYKDKGELEEALKYQKKNIEICESIYENKDHPNLATAYGNLSGIYRHKGELEEALKYQKKNIEIFERIYENKNHPNLAIAYGNLSTIYRHMGELEEALKYQKKNIEICERIYENKNHPNLAIAYGNLSGIYQGKGELEEALKYQKKNIKIKEHIYENKNHPNLATAYSNLALIYQDKEDLKKAIEYQKKDLAICGSIYENKNHPNLMISYANISAFYLIAKDYKKGRDFLSRAYDIYMYNFPNGHPVHDWIKELKEQVLG